MELGSDLSVCVCVLLLQETNPLAGIMGQECMNHEAQTCIFESRQLCHHLCNWYDWMMTLLS